MGSWVKSCLIALALLWCRVVGARRFTETDDGGAASAMAGRGEDLGPRAPEAGELPGTRVRPQRRRPIAVGSLRSLGLALLITSLCPVSDDLDIDSIMVTKLHTVP